MFACSVEIPYFYFVYISCFAGKSLWQSSFLSDNGEKWEKSWCFSSQQQCYGYAEYFPIFRSTVQVSL
jgi:hypothetical protein